MAAKKATASVPAPGPAPERPAPEGPMFTNTWFDNTAKPVWDGLIPRIDPHKVLEVGSFEGASALYLIDALAKSHPLELHCVDTWDGGVEHADVNMNSVEARFSHNTRWAMASAAHPVDLRIHKGFSDLGLARLLTELGPEYFDFVYIDGSHQAPDVLCDAVLGFKLLKVGGVMAFDDYLWSENLPTGRDLLRCPKPAVDAFVNLNFRKLNVLSAPLYQLYIQKIAS